MTIYMLKIITHQYLEKILLIMIMKYTMILFFMMFMYVEIATTKCTIIL